MLANYNFHGLHKPPSENFYALPENLKAVQTKVMYVGVPHPTLKRRLTWTLAGTGAGREGLLLAPQLSGMMHVPFEQLMSEGPYTIGAFPERTDWKSRAINMGVYVNPDIAPHISGESGRLIDNPFRYRMLEDRWWGSWSATEDGYLGVWTRTHGWRWLRVRLASDSKTAFELDPTAYENNFMQWDMSIVATNPYWAKRDEFATWKNTIETSTIWDKIEDLLNEFIPGLHVGEGKIKIPNRGDQPAYPKFIVSSPGKAWIKEGDHWIELPLLTPKDGYVLVDTDPNARTLTASTDPVDPLLFRILRNSQLLDFLLHDILDTGLPVWRRFDKSFSPASRIPPKTLATLEVRHSNADGTITAICPQRYAMAYG
ncbi:minor tail protein [Mycobacterium phage Gaia]|uniref:Minor tail protein n=1 Tax=Mycobacterium phage Gaia TaxID=1486472 RepID=A0A068F3C3_9CAUD|nr:minor tail protein [Mycobacterium phage Gaia]AID58833.1 minor tail protein [Mycobacterium phage Gaia]